MLKVAYENAVMELPDAHLQRFGGAEAFYTTGMVSLEPGMPLFSRILEMQPSIW